MKPILLMAVLLASCDPQVPPQTNCPAAELQDLVGQPASVLQTMRFGSETRIIRPGTAVTMDFLENRLNISIDTKEKISRVYCG